MKTIHFEMKKNKKNYFLKMLLLLTVVFICSLTLSAQEIREVRGSIMDGNAEPIIGATIAIKGTSTGTISDINGGFSVNVRNSDILEISYIGYQSKEIYVGDQLNITVVLEEDAQSLDEVVITAWGTEKKTTMVGAVSTVKPKELKGPTSNLTTMLAGRAAGVISYQLSGEPGRDNAEFFVRGIGSFGSGQSNPLILINGVESTSNELARIQPDDIESFSVLKDATATSMYGSRGANGVLLVKTKSGTIGKPKFNVRYEASMSQNTKDYKIADNITYMQLANEATITRNPNSSRPYSLNKIDKTIAGANPLLYPSNNWKDLMIKDNTWNHRVNLNVGGGADIARYYLAATYKVDNGILKETKLNDFNTNAKSSTMEVRSNIDLTITSSTEASVRLTGVFDELKGPSSGGGSGVFRSMMFANPVRFPAIYPQSFIPWLEHPLFGNKPLAEEGESTALYYNPYSEALKGYSEESRAAMTAQVEINQDFEFLLPGLKARLMAYTKRNTFSYLTREVVPFFYDAVPHLDKHDEISHLKPLNPDQGREYLNYSSHSREVWAENSLEFNLYYNQIFNDVHSVGLTFYTYLKDFKLTNASALERSLPQRNVSFSGRATYGYDSRYMAEFNFGYNASERFAKHNRWGFFPSIGLAWNLAEEHFMESTRDWLDKFKVRLSYGLVGNDNLTDWINAGQERFFYLNKVNMDSGSYIDFGTNYAKTYQQIFMSRYGNPNITWEKAYKYNIAFELGLFQGLNLELDLFRDRRKNILLSRANLPSSLGLETDTPPRANSGEMTSKGLEATLDYNKSINKDMWVGARGTFTYSTNKIDVYDEPEYPDNLNHLSRVGYPYNTHWGLIAERLFIDEEDVANSPKQDFGKYMAGDIKYRDMNGDGVVNSNDLVPMGNPSVPEIVYGFGFSFGYKDFDISAFFQGQARTSFMIDAGSIAPFQRSGGQESGLLDVIATNHWSEENRDLYAFYPRLSTEQIWNNNQSSSWWLRDGAFLRLKTLELGYQPSNQDWLRSIGLSSVRIYLNGMNLFTFSKFKMWDVEMKGNGFGYPLQRVFNAGIQLSF